jgi:cytoskeletal protein CcmA (bactofilin family)
MSWIRPQSDEQKSDAPSIASEPNYNRDMNSPPLPAHSARASSGSATLGQSIRIEGTLTGNEDLTINGTVKGRVNLNGHALTIGPNGKIEAELSAKSVIVEGQVTGNITADDKIRISPSGTVKGDLQAPRIALEDGAHFAGRVDMGSETATSSVAATQPAHATVKR